MSDLTIPNLFTEKTITKKQGGEIRHFLKKNSEGFVGFGEAYFSSIEFGSITDWKIHRQVSCNLSVVSGEVRFVLTSNGKIFFEYLLSAEDNKRLFIPPNFWFGFQGISSKMSLILNIIDDIHDQNEQDTQEINNFDFDWKLQ